MSEADSPSPSAEAHGEHRAPVLATVVVALVVPLLIPGGYSLGPRWLIPVIGGVILVALVVVDPGRLDHRSRDVRWLVITLVGVLVASAAYATVKLLEDLVTGGGVTDSASQLLRAAGLVWVDLVIVFALLYWELDSGGPARRTHEATPYPDLAFPQHLSSEVCPPGWRPVFYDYLYLGFTNSTAFSPTDVMPLAHWAKLTMAVQALTSLVILGLVVARAVNILD